MNNRSCLLLIIALCGIYQRVDAKLFGLFGKKEYSPLVFFKVPKGMSDECKYFAIHFLYKYVFGSFIPLSCKIIELINFIEKRVF